MYRYFAAHTMFPSVHKRERIYYTEDDIPVTTLYVAQFPKNSTEFTLVTYFSKYGEVTNVIFHKTPSNFSYAFVRFSKPEEAANALNVKNHIMDRVKLKVRKADSWHQNSKEIKKTKSNENINTDDNEIKDENESILILNDDCLLQIFSYLDIIELNSIENVCQRFKGLVNMCYNKNKYKSFDFSKYVEKCKSDQSIDYKLTLMNTKDILRIIGDVVTSLTLSNKDFKGSNVRVIYLIPKHCHKLVQLKIEGINISHVTLKNLLGIIGKIISLELYQCSITDQIEFFLTNAHELKELKLGRNCEISGKCLQATKDLTLLNLENCLNIQPKFFSNCIMKNKTLKYLNIQGCDRLIEKNITDIVENLIELEHLVISNSYKYINNRYMKELAELKHLKKIQIVLRSYGTVDELLLELSKKDQLEYLDISCDCVKYESLEYLKKFTKLKTLILNHNINLENSHLFYLEKKHTIEELSLIGCPKITSEGLEFIIKNCPNLNYLDLSGCDCISADFLINSCVYFKNENSKYNNLASSLNKKKKITVIIGQTLIVYTNLDLPTISEYFNVIDKSNYRPKIIELEMFNSFFGLDEFDDIFDVYHGYDDVDDDEYLSDYDTDSDDLFEDGILFGYYGSDDDDDDDIFHLNLDVN